MSILKVGYLRLHLVYGSFYFWYIYIYFEKVIDKNFVTFSSKKLINRHTPLFETRKSYDLNLNLSLNIIVAVVQRQMRSYVKHWNTFYTWQEYVKKITVKYFLWA